jgi:hypothetical protein
MLRVSTATILLLVGLAYPARSDERCASRLRGLVNDWKSIAVPGKTDSGKSESIPAHKHTELEVEYMRRQIRLALQLCNEGKDHEAMLRMDVVRAWLKLPEVQHPSSHRYRYEPGEPLE